MAPSFAPTAPRPAGAASAASATRKPSLVRRGSRSRTSTGRRPLNDAPSPKPLVDPISNAIGDEIFGQGQMFAWCTKGAGMRHVFARWYPRVRVLVDIFGIANAATQAEVASKSDAILAHNEEHQDSQIGYIPYVSGAVLAPDSVAYAKRGGVVPLVLAHPQA